VPEGQFVTATATDANGSTSEFSPCIVAGPNNDSWVTALRVNADNLPVSVDQYLAQEGQSRWYKFKVQPGSRVVIMLTGLPANYDLSLYKDISDTLKALNSEALLNSTQSPQPSARNLPRMPSPDVFHRRLHRCVYPDAFTPDAFTPDAFTPDAFTPDAFTPDAFTPDAFAPDLHRTPSPDAHARMPSRPMRLRPDAFTPDAFTPDAFTSAQMRSLIGVSAFEGTAGEGIAVNTWTQDSDFYVRVRGRNGAYSLQAPFRITMTMLTGQCADVTPISTASSLQATDDSYKTIILTDWSRLPGTVDDKNMLQTRLATFAAQLEVAGVIVDVGTDDRVAAANDQADNKPACPYAKNLVADAIKGIVDDYRQVNPLEYVVIIGNDDVIPFFRSPDQAMLGNELNYSPPVRDNTASQASLKRSLSSARITWRPRSFQSGITFNCRSVGRQETATKLRGLDAISQPRMA
jgi:hypothetical protein